MPSSLDLIWRELHCVSLAMFLLWGEHAAATAAIATSQLNFHAEAASGRRLWYDRRPPPAWGDQGLCARAVGSAPVLEAVHDLPEKWLEAHNHYRSCHGLPNVLWSPVLASYARAWAEELVQHCESVADVHAWVQAGTPQEQRPHDPDQYTVQQPRNGENINTVDGPPVTSEWTHVEVWYREVDTRCPNRGLTPGCGGMLNHYTTMVWTTVAYIGCYTAARGDFEVADCRYASSSPDGGSHCEPPNTFIVPNKASCVDGDLWHAPHVPALIGGQCPQFLVPAASRSLGQNNASWPQQLYSTCETRFAQAIGGVSWFRAWVGMGVACGMVLFMKRWWARVISQPPNPLVQNVLTAALSCIQRCLPY